MFIRATDVSGTSWSTPVYIDVKGIVGQYISAALSDPENLAVRVIRQCACQIGRVEQWSEQVRGRIPGSDLVRAPMRDPHHIAYQRQADHVGLDERLDYRARTRIDLLDVVAIVGVIQLAARELQLLIATIVRESTDYG